MSAIELKSVDFHYGNRHALKDVSFSVQEGKITALLGPNGGGKTTLFRILSTLLKPASGSVRVLGREITDDPFEIRRAIGVVFQTNTADIELTARENLTHQGHLYGLRGAVLKGRIQTLLSRFGLEDRSNERIRGFSGGMRRRVELAQALLHEPSVLLLDEPTNGLDPQARRSFWDQLSDLKKQKENMTILLTTHLMEEAERCDNIVILHEGQVVAEGPPAELKKEVGSEVVVIHSQNPGGLAGKIGEAFQLKAETVGGTLRIERSGGHQFITQIMERFSSEIDSVTISKPTLEDVFLHATGHRFRTTQLAPADSENP